MFRVVFFCDDKKLAAVLHSLAGQVISMEPPQPVVNAEVKSKKFIIAKSNGKLASRFIDYLKTSKIQTFTPKDAAAWCEKHGASRSSYSYVLKLAIEAGLLKRTGASSASVYHVQKLITASKKGE